MKRTNKHSDKQFQQKRFEEIKEHLDGNNVAMAENLAVDDDTCDKLKKSALGVIMKKKQELKTKRFRSKNMIAVESENTSGSDGCILFWKPGKDANANNIANALEKEFGHEIDRSWYPDIATDKYRLRIAVQKLPKNKYNKHNLGQGKWAISEWESTNINTVGITYDPQLKVTIEGDSGIKFSEPGHPLAKIVTTSFENEEGLVPGDNVRETIKKFLYRELDAIPMPCTGGSNYIPQKSHEKMIKFITAYADSTDSTFREISVLKSEKSIQSLAECVIDEATDVIGHAKKQVAKGSGKRALKNRENDLIDAQRKLQRYAKTLGKTFEKIRKKLNETKEEVTTTHIASKADSGDC